MKYRITEDSLKGCGGDFSAAFYDDDFIVKGNKEQIEAITHINGPAMVLAGPGSGKTYVIVQRLKYMITRAHINPANILVITFTKAAALEMQNRFLKETDGKYQNVAFGTFHSVFYQILCRSKPGFRPRLLTSTDKYTLLDKSINKVLMLNAEVVNEYCIREREKVNFSQEDKRLILSEISRLKNEGSNLSNCIEEVPYRFLFKDIFREYTSYCKQIGRIDFDDMVLMCHNLLYRDAKILEKWQNLFKYVLIDEYQDINNLQEQIIRMLCDKSQNIFVVGDDDQSIYGFRGAKPAIMKEFKEYYEDVHNITLKINYRCGQEIVENSLKLISENKNRFVKKIAAANADRAGEFSILKFESEQEEAKFLVDMIVYESMNTSLDKMAVLFRTNSEAQLLALRLSDNNIPFLFAGGFKSFYENKDISLILDYLRFVTNGQQRGTFLRIMNHPLRYIKRDSLKEVVRFEDLYSLYAYDEDMRRGIKRLFDGFNLISRMKSEFAIRFILSEMGVREDVCKNKSSEDVKIFESNVDKMLEDAKQYPDIRKFLKFADDSNEKSKIVKNRCKGESDNNDGTYDKVALRLMTMHSSKGLEFDVVFLPNLNEGVIPSRKSTEDEQIEEERRLLYVGMTRAKNKLYMSYVSGNGDDNRSPSRFLKPLIRKSVKKV